MLAYVFWHRPTAGVATEDYEQALVRFHASLDRERPSGLIDSTSLRTGELTWLPGDGPGYEDWYLLESWNAVGVLEVAAVSRGHESAHREAAKRSRLGAGAIYKLIEGEARPRAARLAVWVKRPAGHGDPRIADLLDDGVPADAGSLWQRSLVLGPAPEYCLLHDGEELPAGLAPSRLPDGWQASAGPRESLLS